MFFHNTYAISDLSIVLSYAVCYKKINNTTGKLYFLNNLVLRTFVNILHILEVRHFDALENV